jgi:hypothetical protein
LQEVGLTLDPVRMYLRDIGRHPCSAPTKNWNWRGSIKVGVAAEAELAS